MKDAMTRRAAVQAAFTSLVDFGESAVRREMLSLLDALAENALAELAKVQPNDLQRRQGILAQLVALRDALRNPSAGVSPIV